MKKKPSIISQNKIFFGGLLVTLFFCMLLVIVDGKGAAFISLNSYHPFFLNVFFINYTFTGDGLFALCLIAMMFFYFKRKQQGFALLYSFLISGVAAQIIKNLVNPPRPKFYFEAGTYLHFTDGVSLASNSGFPSGHTATAFAIATVMVLMMKNKNRQWLILIAALLAGYSRIYLAQHFLLDVMTGAVIGTVSAIPAVYLALNVKSIRKSIKKMHHFPPNPVASPSPVQTV